MISRRSLLLAGVALPVAARTANSQCVTDTPSVDACRGGVRVTSPPGKTLDLSFMTLGTLDPRITFTRASTGTYFDSTGTMQTAATNAPRWDYNPTTLVLNGLLIEEARTNLLLNSAVLVTQNVTVTAVATTLSFYGTGTITLSGASTAGPLTGTGSGRVVLTFTPTAGTLTLTVTGTVTNAQLEAGSFVTSVIITTAAAVTRAQDVCSIADMSWFTSPGGSWFCEFITVNPTMVSSSRVLAQKGGTGITPIFIQATKQVGQNDGVSALTANTLITNALTKAATTWAPGQAKACLNAGAVASSAVLVTGYNLLVTTGIYFMGAFTVPADTTSGYLRRVAYWPRVLSDTELQTVTR